MPNDIDLNLVKYQKSSKETGVIRLPLGARFQGADVGDCLEVPVKEGEILTLQIRKARQEDIAYIRRQIEAGKLTTETAKQIGFVHPTVLAKLKRIRLPTSVGSGFLLGADPEFGLLSGEEFIHGDSVLPKAGVFGSDGPGVEVRPKATLSPHGLIQNIKDILGNPPKAVTKYQWVGGATYQSPQRIYWFGGHLHYGKPQQITQEQAPSFFRRVSSVLDEYIAAPLIHIDLPGAGKRRNGCPHGYGKAGVFTNTPASSIRYDYPGMSHFEYRVLSGLWLTHPVLASAVVSSAKAVVEAVYNFVKEREFSSTAWGNNLAAHLGLLPLNPTRSAINKNDPSILGEGFIEGWEEKFRKLPTFEDHEPEIALLLALIKGDTKAVTRELSQQLDIKANWLEGKEFLPDIKSRKVREAVEEVESRIGE